MKELGVQMIPAYSGQARGRCERSFGTWQKRLPQEPRLAGISTLQQANALLRERYIEWADDKARRKQAGVPVEIQFATKPAIALQQIRAAVEQNVPRAPVLADAAYGTDTRFPGSGDRVGTALCSRSHVLGERLEARRNTLVETKVEGNGTPHEAAATRSGHKPVTIKELARGLPTSAWKTVTWLQGTKYNLRSRFAAVRIRPAHRDYWRSEPYPEEWLLIEWPRGEAEPTKYWFSTLPADTRRTAPGPPKAALA